MMRKRPLLWKLFPPYLVIALLSLAAVGGFASWSIRRFHIERRTADLEIRAHLILRQLPASFPHTRVDSLMHFSQTLAAEAASRLTLVSKQGRTLADSDSMAGAETLGHLPEVSQALAGHTGVAHRFSVSSGSEVLYVAVPVYRREQVAGAIRMAVSLASLEGELKELNGRLLLTGLLVALAAALLTYLFARRIGQAAEEMKLGAERFAGGDFSVRVAVPEDRELGGLAVALNDMAEQLDEKIRTITLQRRELDAILASLREGVIAVDTTERLMFINRAAADLLGLDPEWALGRLLQETVRTSELQLLIMGMLHGPNAVAETELQAGPGAAQVLQVTATELRAASGERIGVLIVLNDVTRLRRLEAVRREFVANVSHELKTPITSIKGFVETLSEGMAEDPDTLRAFLERISRNTDRLNAIIDDLLALSRIEQDGEQDSIALSEASLNRVVEAAIAATAQKARAGSIRVDLKSWSEIRARINPTLLEQALVNLLDNAIKYSEPGRAVEVEVSREGGAAVIHIRDQGSGIPVEHLPRIFERFYRVDKARSRKLGGTGLGLAIVKHIVQAHGGRITAQSALGRGSTFSVYLPE